MAELEALRTAVYLFHLPSAVRTQREKPLPDGIRALLGVAADEDGAAEAAAVRLERPVEVVQQACAFFIEQVMLAPDADAYRILGAARDASDGELRRNMALLLRWVHPDMDRAGDRTIYAGRVTGAWEALKSQERRAAYDAAHPPRSPSRPRPAGRNRSAAGHQLVHICAPSHVLPPRSAPERKLGLIGSALRLLFRRGG